MSAHKKFNHRGERVIKGDPNSGTYRAISSTAKTCMGCEGEIKPGEQFEEDLAIVCVTCCDRWDEQDRRRNPLMGTIVVPEFIPEQDLVEYLSNKGYTRGFQYFLVGQELRCHDWDLITDAIRYWY